MFLKGESAGERWWKKNIETQISNTAKSRRKMKLIAAWEKLKSIDDLTPLQEVQATESPADMPPEVSKLLCPNATDFMMETRTCWQKLCQL